ncbi:MAG: NAD(P)/FAD-dependent oxidoreductase, partial [Caulobacteraceae bacterium]
APAFESLFDAASPPLSLLRRARALWPELAASMGLAINRSGAMAVGAPHEVGRWRADLADLGVRTTALSPASVRRRATWLAGEPSGVWTGEDWRLEPPAALEALRRAAEGLGVLWIGASVTGFAAGQATLGDRSSVACDVLVVASGASASLAGLAPELAFLAPIKGHILRAQGLKLDGPVARLKDLYICPSEGGALIGSTMEAGRSDRTVDAAQVAGLRAMAAGAAPIFAAAPLEARAGVRAATPDGLPVVGMSRTPGVWLAAGARRNGWLLAPLIARALVEALVEGRNSPATRAFDPSRFDEARRSKAQAGGDDV